MHFSVSHSSRFAAPVPDQIDSSARKMKLLIKKTDNDGRLALIPDFLTTSWTIDVADSSNREELARKEVAVRTLPVWSCLNYYRSKKLSRPQAAQLFNPSYSEVLHLTPHPSPLSPHASPLTALHSGFVGLPGTDADDLLNRGDEDLAVADLAGAG